MADSSLKTIAEVTHTLHVGGAEVLAARFARALSDRFRFVFLCLDDFGPLADQLRGEGFPVEVIGRKGGVDVGCPWRLARALRRHGVDLVHAHQWTPFFYSMTARFIYRRPPVVFTEHGRTFPDYPRPKRKVANRLLLRRRDRVVAVGEAVRRALIDNEGFPPPRVAVIYNGISLPTSESSADDRRAARREMAVDDDDFVLLMVARLDALKDHATALRTIDLVRQQRPDARLVLVGDGPEMSAMRRLADERKLDTSVRFLGLRTDVPRLWAGADVALLTSVSEGIPLTLLEAMAHRLPVVSTDVGGIAEVVEDGTTGLLAPSGDAAALAERVLRLADDAAARRTLGVAGRRRAEERFSDAAMFAAYEDLFREMIGT